MTDTQKRLILINDFTGFGRCALTVSLPIVSALGIQGVPVPTAILSNHLGFKSYFYEDFGGKLPLYLDRLSALSFPFDGIYTGYLGSAKNAETVIEFVNKTRHMGNAAEYGDKAGHMGNAAEYEDKIRNQDTTPVQIQPLIITDPVMGDNGRPYSTHTDALLKSLIRLVSISDIITPNLTEACMLTGTEYSGNFGDDEMFKIADKLMVLMTTHTNIALLQNISSSLNDANTLMSCSTFYHNKKIVITGIPYKNGIGNLVYEEGKAPIILKTKIAGAARPGTGDIFASIVSSYAVLKKNFKESVRLSSDFISECIKESDFLNIPPVYGVCFEKKLDMLVK